LPPPPEGSTWQQDKDSNEWKLVAVDRVPELSEESGNNNQNSEREDDWEVLSEKQSVTSGSHKGAVFVSKAGSVRSITTLECYETGSTSSVPFKIQRTNSSSTLDSNENTLGPSGKGILGVDYLEHVILPTDTLQGICLAYKISSTRLKQANHFSGSSLLLAPKKLVIPISKQALRSGFIRVQDTDAKEYKLYSFLAEFKDLSMTEAKA
jgi:LysM repeat protein